MSATNELRRLLDERGVEYETDDRNGLRETIWCGTAAFQLSPTAKMTMIVTPEQAIAATLGSGTLTAAQVRECVEKHWHDLPDEYDMPEATALPEYSYDWQAIADELNSRAERTCKMETDHDELEVIAYSHEDTWAYKCSACDWSFRYDRGIKPNYCPNCGCKVVS